MKKLRTSLLPALLSILALCSFGSASAETIDVQPSTETTEPAPVAPVTLVKSVNSVEANISYTAATLDEKGQIVWNIPQSIIAD